MSSFIVEKTQKIFKKNDKSAIMIVESRRLDMDNFNNGISPNPFEKLNETELLFLLEHNKERLTEAQILDIKAKLNSFQIVREAEKKQELPQVQKVYTKTMPEKQNKAGYVNIIVLMLTVWATCLCGIFYIYFNIMG